MQDPKLECDVIMKGGITSGVVYPKAILELAKKYRFRSIGGTSAGAIAAAITAAAEYGRSTGGFDEIGKIPGEMEEQLASLFQPAPQARGIFRVVMQALSGGTVAAVLPALRLEWVWPALTLLLALLLAALSLALGWGTAASVFAFLFGCALTVLVVAWRLYAFATHRLPALLKALDYGLCPGTTQDRTGRPGLSDWLAVKIERAAGRMKGDTPPERPLTFGDLKNAARPAGSVVNGDEETIELRMVTTNLSMRRPHTLPNLGDDNFYWLASEFEKVFPKWVVAWMAGVCEETPLKQAGETLYQFPQADELPVVVAARMSLSFPILISAVPLYRRDFPAAEEGAEAPVRRLLFSDGGLSSNFPIHFFDALCPDRPTFGIALETFDPHRPKRRVNLPMPAAHGQWLDIDPIDGLGDFAWSLLNSAKDWQDRLQSVLPGYRERIVHVYLDDTQGGLNLDMSAETIRELTDYGARAGKLLSGDAAEPGCPDRAPFDFADHRWRRFLIAFARLEETLERCGTAWGVPEVETSFAHAIQEIYPDPPSYKGASAAWRQEVFAAFDDLMSYTRTMTPLRLDPNGRIPKPDTNMRITPKS